MPNLDTINQPRISDEMVPSTIKCRVFILDFSKFIDISLL